MSINKCVFMGNLGADPDLRYLPTGTAVVNFSIACSKRWTDKATGEIKDKTEWIRLVSFGRRAEVIAEHFKKGSLIYVEGEQCTRSYEKDGVKHWVTEIVVSEFQFCGQQGNSGNDARASQQASAYGKAQPNNPTMPPVPPAYEDFNDDIPF